MAQSHSPNINSNLNKEYHSIIHKVDMECIQHHNKQRHSLMVVMVYNIKVHVLPLLGLRVFECIPNTIAPKSLG